MVEVEGEHLPSILQIHNVIQLLNNEKAAQEEDVHECIHCLELREHVREQDDDAQQSVEEVGTLGEVQRWGLGDQMWQIVHLSILVYDNNTKEEEEGV